MRSPVRADPLEILDQLLITRLIVMVSEMKFRRFPFELEESISSEPRLILIRRVSDGFLSIICGSGDGFRFSFVVRNRKGSWIY